MVRMIAFIPLFLVACGASPSTPDPVVVQIPVAPSPVKPDAANVLVAEADKTRQEVTSAALSGDPSNDFLIRLIGLTHTLDEAVSDLEEHHTKPNMDAVRRAIRNLQRVK